MVYAMVLKENDQLPWNIICGVALAKLWEWRNKSVFGLEFRRLLIQLMKLLDLLDRFIMLSINAAIGLAIQEIY